MSKKRKDPLKCKIQYERTIERTKKWRGKSPEDYKKYIKKKKVWKK